LPRWGGREELELGISRCKLTYIYIYIERERMEKQQGPIV